MSMANPIKCVRSVLRPTPTQTSDGDLVARFADHRDEAAFAELLDRHGRMVYAVCRRALGDGPDAEDAFQAVFLVLANRAGSIRGVGRLAGWLYRVACLTAKKARHRRAKRRTVEATVGDLPDVPAPAASAHELGGIIDEELAKVPDKYRTAVVLCELQQLTLDAAAAALGVPRGTVASRLARGRELLGKRLLRRGVLAAGVGAATSAVARPPHAVIRSLLDSVFEQSAAPDAADVSLSQEVLRAMNESKLRSWGAGMLLVSGLIVGGVVLTTLPSDAAPVPDAKAKSTDELKVLDRVAVENVGGLLACPAVAKELDLSVEQKAKLDEAWDQVSAKLIAKFKARAAGPQSPQQMLAVLGFIDEAVRENDRAALPILRPDQLRRLRQIQLQKEGPSALVGRYAVRALTLTPDQEDRLSAVVGTLNKTGFTLLNFELGAAAEDANANPNAQLMKDTVRQVVAAQVVEVEAVRDEALKLLTKEQRARWAQMVGEPIPTGELLTASSSFSDRRIVKAYSTVEQGNVPQPQPPVKAERP